MKKIIINNKLLLAVTTSLILGCDNTGTSTQNTEGIIERALAYEKNGQYRAAFIELKNALMQDPENVSAKTIRAELQLKTGQPRSAATTLESITSEPTSTHIEIYAKALVEQDRYQSALNYIQLHISNCSDICLTAKGDALSLLKKFEDAESAYLSALEKDKDNADAKLGLAKLYYLSKRPDEGDTLLDNIIVTHPDHTNALIYKASLLSRAEKHADAEELLNKALLSLPSTDIVIPNRLIIIENLIDSLTTQGRPQDALIYSKILAELDPKGSELRSMMDEAITLYNNQNYDEARDLLEKINQDTDNNKVKTLLGAIEYKSGNYEQASKLLEDSINIETSTPATKSALVDSYIQLGMRDKALEFLSKDYQANSNNTATLNLYADTLLKTGNTEQALEYLENSLKIDPNQPLALVSKYHYYTQKGDLLIAEDAIQSAFDLSPENRSILTLYINHLAQTNKLDKASQKIDTLINKTPNNAYLYHLSAQTYNLKNLPEKALDNYKKSIELDKSKNNPSHLALANFYLFNKKHDLSLSKYKEMAEQGIDNTEIYKGIITAYELKSDAEKGIAYLNNIAKNKATPNAHIVLAEYHFINNNNDTAIEHLHTISNYDKKPTYTNNTLNELIIRTPTNISSSSLDKLRNILARAINENPRNPLLMYKLIDVELENKNLSTAKELTEKLATTNNSYAPYFYKSKIAILENKKDEALSIAKNGWSTLKNDEAGNHYYNFLSANKLPTELFVDEWLNSLPDSKNAKLYKAISLQEKKPEESVKIYEELVNKDPNFYQALNNLAWTYQQLNDPRALSTAEKAYKGLPNNPATLDTYGWILFKNNKIQDALAILEKAKTLEPNQTEIIEHYNIVKNANAK